MRAFFILLLIAGIGGALVYPWATQNFAGAELGTYRVFERGSGFKPVDVQLQPEDAPVRVLVDLSSSLQPAARNSETVLTITVAAGSETILAKHLNFIDVSAGRDDDVTGNIYRDDAGLIEDVTAGSYRFTVGPGDVDDIPISRVELVLRAGASEWDHRAQPIGFVAMAIGFIGLVLTFRRAETPPQNPNSQPPPPRWGRR